MVRSKSGPTYRPPLLEHFEFCNPDGLGRFVELAVHLDVMSLMLSDCVRIGDGVDLAALLGHDYKLGALGHVLLVRAILQSVGGALRVGDSSLYRSRLVHGVLHLNVLHLLRYDGKADRHDHCSQQKQSLHFDSRFLSSAPSSELFSRALAPLMHHASKSYISRSNLDCGSGIFFGGRAGRAAT